jgi:hypothetical protein
VHQVGDQTKVILRYTVNESSRFGDLCSRTGIIEHTTVMTDTLCTVFVKLCYTYGNSELCLQKVQFTF